MKNTLLVMLTVVLYNCFITGCIIVDMAVDCVPWAEPEHWRHPEAYYGTCMDGFNVKARFTLFSYPNDGSVRGSCNVVLVIKANPGERWDIMVSPSRFARNVDKFETTECPSGWNKSGCQITSLYFKKRKQDCVGIAENTTWFNVSKDKIANEITQSGKVVDLDWISEKTDKCCAVLIFCGRWGQYVRMPYLGNWYRPIGMVHGSDMLKEAEDWKELFMNKTIVPKPTTIP